MRPPDAAGSDQQPRSDMAGVAAASRGVLHTPPALPGPSNTGTQSQAGGKRAKAFGIFARQVRHQTLAAAHHGEQAAAGVVVVLVRTQILAQLVDAPREDGNLHFW